MIKRYFLNLSLALLLFLGVIAVPPAQADSFTYTAGIDYTGGDLYNQPEASPGDCASACFDQAACSAWSWANGTCYLKTLIFQPQANSNVTSGTEVFPLEPGVDRFGSDIKNIAFSSVDPNQCIEACWNTTNCDTFTIVYNSSSSMTCYLKQNEPAAVPANGNLVSGLMSNY